MQNWAKSWAKWYSKEENIKHRQLRIGRLAAENPHLKELGVGGGGGVWTLLLMKIILIKSGHSDQFSC